MTDVAWQDLPPLLHGMYGVGGRRSGESCWWRIEELAELAGSQGT
jgi:hypothetical protein